MMNRNVILLLAAGVLAGCSNQPSVGGSSADAERLRNERAKFEAENVPVNADSHFAAGQLSETEGKYDDAISQYQEALKADPNNEGALFRLGSIYTVTNQFAQAQSIWQRYIKVTHDSGAGYADLGYCQELWGHPAEAEASYKTAVAKDPDDQAARMNYGLMLARQGRMSEATVQLSVAGTPAEVHYNLASVLESQGKKAEAKVEYERALAADPQMNDARVRMAGLDRE